MIKGELIGRNIKIISSKNKGLIGKKGKIVDETKNMLLIKSDNKLKKLIKSQLTFRVKINKKIFMIKGESITKRPEDRLKK